MEVRVEDRRRRSPSQLLTPLGVAESVLYFSVAVVLVAIGVALLVHTVGDALTGSNAFVDRVTAAVNGVLFVVIVLELFRTVLAHLEGGGFQLRPFLVIGIISAVRHILLIGTRSLASEKDTVFNHTQIELGVNAAVALGLVVALLLVHRSVPPEVERD